MDFKWAATSEDLLAASVVNAKGIHPFWTRHSAEVLLALGKRYPGLWQLAFLRIFALRGMVLPDGNVPAAYELFFGDTTPPPSVAVNSSIYGPNVNPGRVMESMLMSDSQKHGGLTDRPDIAVFLHELLHSAFGDEKNVAFNAAMQSLVDNEDIPDVAMMIRRSQQDLLASYVGSKHGASSPAEWYVNAMVQWIMRGPDAENYEGMNWKVIQKVGECFDSFYSYQVPGVVELAQRRQALYQRALTSKDPTPFLEELNQTYSEDRPAETPPSWQQLDFSRNAIGAPFRIFIFPRRALERNAEMAKSRLQTLQVRFQPVDWLRMGQQGTSGLQQQRLPVQSARFILPPKSPLELFPNRLPSSRSQSEAQREAAAQLEADFERANRARRGLFGLRARRERHSDRPATYGNWYNEDGSSIHWFADDVMSGDRRQLSSLPERQELPLEERVETYLGEHFSYEFSSEMGLYHAAAAARARTVDEDEFSADAMRASAQERVQREVIFQLLSTVDSAPFVNLMRGDSGDDVVLQLRRECMELLKAAAGLERRDVVLEQLPPLMFDKPFQELVRWLENAPNEGELIGFFGVGNQANDFVSRSIAKGMTPKEVSDGLIAMSTVRPTASIITEAWRLTRTMSAIDFLSNAKRPDSVASAAYRQHLPRLINDLHYRRERVADKVKEALPVLGRAVDVQTSQAAKAGLVMANVLGTVATLNMQTPIQPDRPSVSALTMFTSAAAVLGERVGSDVPALSAIAKLGKEVPASRRITDEQRPVVTPERDTPGVSATVIPVPPVRSTRIQGSRNKSRTSRADEVLAAIDSVTSSEPTPTPLPDGTPPIPVMPPLIVDDRAAPVRNVGRPSASATPQPLGPPPSYPTPMPLDPRPADGKVGSINTTPAPVPVASPAGEATASQATRSIHTAVEVAAISTAITPVSPPAIPLVSRLPQAPGINLNPFAMGAAAVASQLANGVESGVLALPVVAETSNDESIKDAERQTDHSLPQADHSPIGNELKGTPNRGNQIGK